MAGLFAYNDQRKQSSRESLLLAATELFCRDGYAAVSIEDITSAAGVSRITFYRHFASKAAVALELFQRAGEIASPKMLEIGARDYRDRAIVIDWLHDFFDLNRELRGILRVLSQANVDDADFAAGVRPVIYNMVKALGKAIPAFDVNPGSQDQRRWVKAWLLIYTILDQSNHAATTEGVSANPMMVEVLADSFLAFVNMETN